jgi:hypothetical protein
MVHPLTGNRLVKVFEQEDETGQPFPVCEESEWVRVTLIGELFSNQHDTNPVSFITLLVLQQLLELYLSSKVASFCCLCSSRTPRSFSTAWTPSWADKFLTCGLDASLAAILSVATREKAMEVVIVF